MAEIRMGSGLSFRVLFGYAVRFPRVLGRVAKLTLCETRSLTLVALRHCLRIALS